MDSFVSGPFDILESVPVLSVGASGMAQVRFRGFVRVAEKMNKLINRLNLNFFIGLPCSGEIAPVDHRGFGEEHFGFRVIPAEVHETADQRCSKNVR